MKSTQQETSSPSIWSKLLSDSQSNVGAISDAHILILGDERNGKKTIIGKLMGKEVNEMHKHEGYALEYTYMKIKSDFDESLLSIWSMGDANFAHLIENNPCLQIPNLKLVIITADLSRPGKVFMELQRWTSVLRRLYENCDKKYKQKMKTMWAKAMPSNKDKKEEDLDINDIGQYTLSVNLGVPVIFALTKSDLATEELENHLSSCGLNIDMLQQYQNFILYKLRHFALTYGAGLFITSSSKNTNITALRDYISQLIINQSIIATNGLVQEAEKREEVSVPNIFDDYENAAICIGEDSVSVMDQLDLKLFFANNTEALHMEVKELIPEEKGILMELEGYRAPSSAQDLGEYVTVVDYQSFLARQVKSQSLYRSRSAVNLIQRGELGSESSPVATRSDITLSTTPTTVRTIGSTNSSSPSNVTIELPRIHSTGSLNTSVSSDTKLEEEAEDFFNSMLKKIKK